MKSITLNSLAFLKKSYRTVTIALITCIYALSIVSVFATTMIDYPNWQHQQMIGKPSLRGSAILGNSMWVTGSNNAIFVSQNGGKTWLDKSVSSLINTDFRDIELFDSQTAIVMSVGNAESSMLYKTSDGGNNWQLLYQNSDEKGFFDSIAFWDENNGLLLGDPVAGFYVVKKTVDGGKTWRRIAKNKLPKILDKESAFAASGNTMIVGKNGKVYITTGGFSASVYFSDDHGENWQRQEVPLYNETQTAGGYGLAINNQGQPFALGGDYLQRSMQYANITTYVDGQWKAVNTGERGLRTAMSCQETLCLATGKTSTDISHNSGKTWSALPVYGSQTNDSGFYTLASDNMVFLAAGAEGKVAVLKFKGQTKPVKNILSRLKK
ncbi:MAG: oxidoreductase [Colwellia sp.]|nr:oxidoreductase [Colwellia sp.]